MFRFSLSIVKLIILACSVVVMIQYSLIHGSYVFSPKRIKQIAEKHSGQPISESVLKIDRELQAAYGKHVGLLSRKFSIDYFTSPSTKRSKGPSPPLWIPFNGGGMTGKVHVVHVSFKEYLVLISSPVRTVSSIGMMWMNHSCSVLEGRVDRINDFQRDTFEPGSHMRFNQFETSVVEIDENTSMLCYGRGFTPTAVPYILSGSLSKGDVVSALQITFVVLFSVGQVMYNWLEDTMLRILQFVKIK